MKRKKWLSIFLLLGTLTNMQAEAVNVVNEKFNKSQGKPIEAPQDIRSVKHVKDNIRELLDTVGQQWCDTLSCSGFARVQICEVVSMLNTRVSGKIAGKTIKTKYSPLSISQSDLRLMKRIYSGCEPLGKRIPPALGQPKYGKIFNNSCDKQIRKALNLKPSQRCN
ncbi:hypothetical protein CAL7716_105730 (plasmid) [Calothrix sp. PCC 7716]|nr:hypothetical protein CAL7716_105730 [Calothrix sp. PCC 7716]